MNVNRVVAHLQVTLFCFAFANASYGNGFSTKSIAAFFGGDTFSMKSETIFNLTRKIQSGRFASSPYRSLHRSSNDSFLLAYHLCKAFKYGISSVFSSVTDDTTIQAIDSFTRAFEIPHVTLSSKNVIKNAGYSRVDSQFSDDYPTNTFQLMPHIEKAVFDYMYFNNWTSAVVFYDDDIVNDNFRYYSSLYMLKEMTMEVKHVTSENTAKRYLLDYQQAGRNAENSGVNFLLLTAPETTYMVVKLAEDLQMLNRFNNFLVADTRVACERFQLTMTGQINVFCFRTKMPADKKQNFTVFKKELMRLMTSATSNENSDNIALLTDYELALLADFHQMFTKIYSDSDVKAALELFDPGLRTFRSPPFAQFKPCLDFNVSPLAGVIIANELRNLKMTGFSGNIEFDSNGMRKNFELDILRAASTSAGSDTANLAGTWNDNTGYNFMEEESEEPVKISLAKSVIRIVTIVTEPFTMYKKGKEDATEGVDNFEGFCIDMLIEIAKENNMTFHLHLVHDGKYGEELKNGSWNGMIGELMRGQADVAIAPLTISSERQRVVDFTKPYMDVGVSIMMKIQEKEENMFSFLIPLQTDIWMCIILSYISVSVVYFVVSRISLLAWMKPEHREIKDEDFKYTLSNCFFLTLGAVLQRGEDMCTKESPVSSRIVGGGWWFFTLIIISSYTANLAAFLTVDRMKTPINGADDLAGQTQIEYGTLDSGSSKAFFKTSQLGTFQRMYKFMEDRDTFKPSVQKGVDAVREQPHYAFLLESTMNEYHNQQLPCNTRQIGNNLNSKNYGIATPSGSPLLNQLTVAILELMERGYISERKNYWWYEKGECQFKASVSPNKNANALELGDVWGVFYILIGGSIIGFVVCICEFVIVSVHQARRLKLSIPRVLFENFRHCAKSMVCSLPKREKPKTVTMNTFQSAQATTYAPAILETIDRSSFANNTNVFSEDDMSLLDMDKNIFVQL